MEEPTKMNGPSQGGCSEQSAQEGQRDQASMDSARGVSIACPQTRDLEGNLPQVRGLESEGGKQHGEADKRAHR